ncbi:MAG: DUF2097 domain-containing protein [Methanococci archaeon]|nr:DUF2097 domain-containing protein [Methanococci archaeon]
MKEKIIDMENPKDIIDYLNSVDLDEYVEIYFGRVHVEGRLMQYSEGFVRLVHEKYGIIEVELENILNDLLEVVHSDGERRVVIRFY